MRGPRLRQCAPSYSPVYPLVSFSNGRLETFLSDLAKLEANSALDVCGRSTTSETYLTRQVVEPFDICMQTYLGDDPKAPAVLFILLLLALSPACLVWFLIPCDLLTSDVVFLFSLVVTTWTVPPVSRATW